MSTVIPRKNRAMAAVIVFFFSLFLCVESARKSSPAFAQTVLVPEATNNDVMPQHTAGKAAVSEVQMKPDLEAKGFSAQNAYYFARLSSFAYKKKNEVKGLLVGNSTCEGLGFDRFHWFEAGDEAKASLFDAIHDTEAYVTANDDMVAVVFRGTMETMDWATNLRIIMRQCPESWKAKGGEVHEGFDDGISCIWEPRGMYKTIKDLCNEKGKDRKLFISGHSLGGALATIAAARLALEDEMDIAAIYTIGSPRVFDKTCSKRFNAKKNNGKTLKSKYFRCRNNNDIVPRAVPFPYQHVGTEIYLDRFGTITATSLMDRLLGRLNAYLRGEFIEDINDHATSEYIRLFKQVVINSRVSLTDKAKSALGEAAAGVASKVAPNGSNAKETKKRAEIIEGVKAKARQDALGF